VPILITILAAYAIGSVPVAFLFVRMKTGGDVRVSGSGNAGALNAYKVTKSTFTGVLVGLLDAAKGLLAVLLAAQISQSTFDLQAMALTFTILGHNYPVWTKFRGGRGLATAAGGMFAIGVSYTIAWCVTWFCVFLFQKDILRANIGAIVIAPLLVLLAPASWIDSLMVAGADVGHYRVFAFLLSGLFLLSHRQPLRDLFHSKQSSL
jgi:glycerol-3-phosphate acyltransferase PlsY